MKYQRKAVSVLLYTEKKFLQLATFMENSIQTIGIKLKELCFGRNGQNLQSTKRIYARNLFRYNHIKQDSAIRNGDYIRRVGKLGHVRKLVIGKVEEKK